MSSLGSPSFVNAAGTAADKPALDLSGRGLGPFISQILDAVYAGAASSKFLGAMDFANRSIRNLRQTVQTVTGAVTLGPIHKGTVLLVNSASGVAVTLPNNWKVGDYVDVRATGAGAVSWTAASGATVVLPTARSSHTKLASQHSEARFRVVANANDATAVWSIVGETSA